MDFKRWFPVHQPDEEYEYLEPGSNAKDAQFVRLALDLYRQGKHALVLKTLDFYDKEEPASGYRHEMRFLRANAMMKLGLEKKAEPLLEPLLVDAKESPAALHSAMYLAARSVQQESHLAALERFHWLINHHSGHRLAWVFHLGAAEALYLLKQTERASKEYDWVVANAPDAASKAEAALRQGDLHMERRDYDQALASYYRALERYREPSGSFPSIHLNRAEALYWLGQYDRAVEGFTAFLADFPAHPSGWRATFRLGELMARQGGEKGIELSRKWFTDTINRYPYSPGVTLSRLRLLPCGDHAGMKPETAEAFFAGEASQFTGDGEIMGDQYSDLRALSRVRTLAMMGLKEKATAAAIEELGNGFRSDLRPVMGDLLETMFRLAVIEKLDTGKKVEALSFYRDRAASVPPRVKNRELIDPDYLLRLSRVASDLGLGEMAQQLSSKYQKALKDGQGARQPAGDTADPEMTKMVSSERAFTEAKALWISEGHGGARKIREKLAQVDEESPYSYGREIILGLIEERSNNPVLALSHALKAQLLIPSGEEGKSPEEQARVNHWVASLQEKAGDAGSALVIYRNLENYLKSAEKNRKVSLPEILGVPEIRPIELLVSAQAEILAKQGKWGESAQAYSRAVEAGLGGNHLMYEYARALERSGDAAGQQKALEVLKRLAESQTDDFWRKLAREALENRRAIAKEGNS